MSAGSFGLPAALAVLVLIAAAAARGTWSPCGLSMISAINPFSERSRGHRYGWTVVWFVTGALAGGAVLGGLGAVGAIAVAAGGLPAALVCGLAAGCSLLAAAGDADRVPFHLPLIPRQVNERWLSGYRRWFYASGFGAQIGVGLVTYVMTAAVYLVPVLGALSGSPSFAMVCGLTFGLVRGLAILLTATAVSPARLRALHRRLAELAPRSLQLVLVLELGAALVFSLAAGGLPVVLAVAAGLAGVALWTRRGRVDRRPAAVVAER